MIRMIRRIFDYLTTSRSERAWIRATLDEYDRYMEGDESAIGGKAAAISRGDGTYDTSPEALAAADARARERYRQRKQEEREKYESSLRFRLGQAFRTRFARAPSTRF